MQYNSFKLCNLWYYLLPFFNELQFTATWNITYYQANINLEKRLLTRDSVLIYLIQVSQKYKNKRNAFDSYEFKIKFAIILNYLLLTRLS